MTDRTPYDERIRQCFSEAFLFLDRHKHIRTDEDWDAVSGELGQYTDPLTLDLLIAVIEELEREYQDNQILKYSKNYRGLL